MKKIAFTIPFFVMVSLASLASAQQIYTPQRGTAERSQILDEIRPLLDVRVGKPVEFVVSFMRVYQDWAFVAVEPQRPGGGAISTHGPTYRMWDSDGGLSTYALLKYDYGRWNCVDFVIGPTDVFWDGDPLYDQFPSQFLFGSD